MRMWLQIVFNLNGGPPPMGVMERGVDGVFDICAGAGLGDDA